MSARLRLTAADRAYLRLVQLASSVYDWITGPIKGPDEALKALVQLADFAFQGVFVMPDECLQSEKLTVGVWIP